MRLKVIDPIGASLPGHGSRQVGEVFELPDDLAQQYAQTYPERFTLEVDQDAEIEVGPTSEVPARLPGLEHINGIGPETAAALRAAGITTLEQLVVADVADLAKRLDGSNTRQVRDWQRQAARMTANTGKPAAALLKE